MGKGFAVLSLREGGGLAGSGCRWRKVFILLTNCRHRLKFENGRQFYSFLPQNLNVAFACFVGLLSLTFLDSVQGTCLNCSCKPGGHR